MAKKLFKRSLKAFLEAFEEADVVETTPREDGDGEEDGETGA